MNLTTKMFALTRHIHKPDAYVQLLFNYLKCPKIFIFTREKSGGYKMMMWNGYSRKMWRTIKFTGETTRITQL